MKSMSQIAATKVSTGCLTWVRLSNQESFLRCESRLAFPNFSRHCPPCGIKLQSIDSAGGSLVAAMQCMMLHAKAMPAYKLASRLSAGETGSPSQMQSGTAASPLHKVNFLEHILNKTPTQHQLEILATLTPREMINPVAPWLQTSLTWEMSLAFPSTSISMAAQSCLMQVGQSLDPLALDMRIPSASPISMK